jgi:hypothetical protein
LPDTIRCSAHKNASRSRAGDGAVRGGERGRLAQLRAAQRGQDRVGPLRDLVAAGVPEDCRDLGGCQLLRAGGVGCLAQQLQGVSGVQVLERGHCGREVFQQLGPQPLRHRGPLPDQRLVGAGQHLDRFGLRAVGSGRAQLVRIGAHRIGQHVRVPAVAFGSRHAMPAAVPGRLQRVHREHHVTRGDQRRHPRAAVGLDRDLNLHVRALFWQEPADQLVQLPDPGHPLRHPPAGQHIPGLVHHLDVVMVLRPVIPD